MKKIYIVFLTLFILSSNIFGQAYYPLASGAFTQNWTDASLITANDNWTNVPNIRGFLGQDLTTATATNPSTILTGASSVANDLDVVANQSAPNTFVSGAVAEFDGIPNPSIALQGSGTADAPHLIIYLNTTGVTGVNVQYNLRDIDGSADNAVQPVALQYRIGNTGNFTNIPGAFVADASTGPSLASLVTAISVTLPAVCENQSQVELRIITTNAVGSDELIAVDDINIFTGSIPSCPEPVQQPTGLVLNATATSVSGSFTAIASPTTVENYFIVRSTSTTLTQLPVDGTSYANGQIIEGGNGIAVGISSDGSFINSVSPSTQYYYFIFALNDQGCSGGPNYNQLNPLSGDVTTPALANCVTPSAPTLLTLTPSNSSISGSFTGSGAAKYLTVISSSVTLGSTPVNGTLYSAGQAFGTGSVVSYSTSTTFAATGLTVATSYYLFVFAVNDACTGEPFYSSASLDGTINTTNNPTGIPAGYYDAAAGLSCAALKTALSGIITTGHTQNNYGSLDDVQFLTTDDRLNDAGTATVVYDMYSDNPLGVDPYTYTFSQFNVGSGTDGEGNGWNKEHSFPNSWFSATSSTNNFPGADLNHLFPTDMDVNSLRGNYPYGVVASASTTTLNGSKLGTSAISFPGYSGPVFEPIDAYKGDLARATLYMVTRYQAEQPSWEALQPTGDVVMDGTTWPSVEPAYLQMLISWHNADPVSAKEIERNNEVFGYQHNRNPFIDHPEFVGMIWGSACSALPVSLTSFQGQLLPKKVLLKWTAENPVGFSHFIVERSTDGIAFHEAGRVASANVLNFDFTDYDLPATPVVYYRLRMVDIDGSFRFSPVIPIKLPAAVSRAILYPNPVTTRLQVKFAEPLYSGSTLQVTDVQGRVVLRQALSGGTMLSNTNVAGLTAGKYFILISNSKQQIRESFIITR
jgi:endonuclease I